jgi:hypothetical protein
MDVTLWNGNDTTSKATPIETSNENLRIIYDAWSEVLIGILNDKWMNLLESEVTWNEMLSPYSEGR